MLHSPIKKRKTRAFIRMLKKHETFTVKGYVFVLMSIRGNGDGAYVEVRRIRDMKVGEIRLCDVVIKKDGRDFKLSDIKLLDIFRR